VVTPLVILFIMFKTKTKLFALAENMSLLFAGRGFSRRGLKFIFFAANIDSV
jgi:hypothetical protein